MSSLSVRVMNTFCSELSSKLNPGGPATGSSIRRSYQRLQTANKIALPDATWLEPLHFLQIGTTCVLLASSAIPNLTNLEAIQERLMFQLVTINFVGPSAQHANILVYDRLERTVERFEPNGTCYVDDLDQKLRELIVQGTVRWQYASCSSFMPKHGPQAFDNLATEVAYHKHRMRSGGGYCLAWCLLYAMLRTAYPDTALAELVSVMCDWNRQARRDDRLSIELVVDILGQCSQTDFLDIRLSASTHR